LIGGSSTSPNDVPVCRSSVLATATISPAVAASSGCVFSPCTDSSGPILIPFRAPVAGSVLSFFIVPEYTRM
jgi:hypothetical protein